MKNDIFHTWHRFRAVLWRLQNFNIHLLFYMITRACIKIKYHGLNHGVLYYDSDCIVQYAMIGIVKIFMGFQKKFAWSSKAYAFAVFHYFSATWWRISTACAVASSRSFLRHLRGMNSPSEEQFIILSCCKYYPNTTAKLFKWQTLPMVG